MVADKVGVAEEDGSMVVWEVREKGVCRVGTDPEGVVVAPAKTTEGGRLVVIEGVEVVVEVLAVVE